LGYKELSTVLLHKTNLPFDHKHMPHDLLGSIWGRGDNTAILASATVRTLQQPEEPSLVRVATLLHDIGKIGIPDAVLHKPALLPQSAGLSEYVGPGS
jgi:hypothetical protein